MYDLISINGVSAPDVKKGTLTITPNPKYNEFETEDGGKVIDVVAEEKLMGSVSYDGLLQSEISALRGSIRLVSQMQIYNPFTNGIRSFTAKITVTSCEKIIHDAGANAWSFAFDFEEIGDASNE